MKHLLTTLILFVSALTCYSQTPLSKGQLFLSGNFNVSNGKADNTDPQLTDYDNKNISIAPVIGYFVNPQTVVGLSIGYGNSLTKTYYDNDNYKYTQKTKDNSFSIGPVIRRYIPLGGKFAFFGQGDAFIRFSKSKQETFTDNPQQVGNTETDSKNTFFGAGIKSGVAAFLTKRFSFETSLNLASFTYGKNENYEGFSLTINPLSSITVGVAWYLGKGSE